MANKANEWSLIVIARIIDKDGNLLGCRVVRSDDKGTKDAAGNTYLKYTSVGKADIIRWLSGGTSFVNLAMTNKRELKGVGGDLSRYTTIDNESEQIVGEPAYVILAKLEGADAYKICDYNGKVLRVKTSVIAEKCKLANGKVCINDKGTKYISAISGEYEQEIMPQRQAPVTQPTKPVTPVVPSGIMSPGATIEDPVPITPPQPSYQIINPINIYNLRATYAGNVNLEEIYDKHNPRLTLSSKLMKIPFTLLALSPLHNALYGSMNKLVTREIPTMAVNTTEFIINPDFLAELTDGEMLFVVYHELGHVFYGHTARRGNRDPEIWNIAADFIVNKAFADQFGVVPGETKALKCVSALIKEVSMLKDCLYDPKYDPKTMSTEEVYNDIKGTMEHNKTKEYLAGLKGGKAEVDSFKLTCTGKDMDYQFDYRLGAEAAYADIQNGYTLQTAYSKGYTDANKGRAKADTSKFAPKERAAYDFAYDTARNGGVYCFERLYFDGWGAYWRGTTAFEKGYKDVVTNAVNAYRNLEDGVV